MNKFSEYLLLINDSLNNQTIGNALIENVSFYYILIHETTTGYTAVECVKLLENTEIVAKRPFLLKKIKINESLKGVLNFDIPRYA